MEAVWRPVVNYEGLYEVSDCGQVRNVKRCSLLKNLKTNCGYYQVYLYKDGVRKGLKVHRLVAEAFIPNPLSLPQVNHKDEVKTNNNVDNLEWCTVKYNVNYGCRTDNAIHRRVENGYADPDFIGFGLDTKEYMKVYNKYYRDKNNDKLKEYHKIYYQEHKDKLRDKHREYLREWRRRHN